MSEAQTAPFLSQAFFKDCFTLINHDFTHFGVCHVDLEQVNRFNIQGKGESNCN